MSNQYVISNLNTSPLRTNLIKDVVAGANMNRKSSFPTTVVDTVNVQQKLGSLRMFYLNKTDRGVISLHQLAPVLRVGHGLFSGKDRVQSVLHFIAISCNKNEFKTSEHNISVYKDSNLAMLEDAFDPECGLNALSYVGSPNTAYTPTNSQMWNTPMGDTTVGDTFNKKTLNTFFYIQGQLALLGKDGAVEEKIEAEIAKAWSAYENNRDLFIKNGFLRENTVTYVDPSKLQNASVCFQNTTSLVSKFLNAEQRFGNTRASYAPSGNVMTGVGIVLDDQVHKESGYQLGQFSVQSRKDSVITVPESEKATTVERTTRAISVTDSSGRSTKILMSVTDIPNGNSITKRSDRFASLPVGSTVMFKGDFQIRLHADNTLGVSYRVTEPDWDVLSSASIANVVVATETTFSEMDFEPVSLEGLANNPLTPVETSDDTEDTQEPIDQVGISADEDPALKF